MAIETHNRVAYEGDPVREEEHTVETRGETRGRSRETLRKSAAGGTALAAFAGVATVVLGILGLVGIAPLYMAAIAAIVVGAGLLLEGGFTTAWFLGARDRYSAVAEGGMSAGFAGGVAAIVLGILALVGINADQLLPIAALAAGASMFIGAWGSAVSGAKMFVGLGAIVLGILALVGTAPMILTLVGFICLGAGSLLSGSAHSAGIMAAEPA